VFRLRIVSSRSGATPARAPATGLEESDYRSLITLTSDESRRPLSRDKYRSAAAVSRSPLLRNGGQPMSLLRDGLGLAHRCAHRACQLPERRKTAQPQQLSIDLPVAQEYRFKDRSAFKDSRGVLHHLLRPLIRRALRREAANRRPKAKCPLHGCRYLA